MEWGIYFLYCIRNCGMSLFCSDLGETDRTSGGIETGFSAFPKELILGLAGIALLGTIGNIYLE